MQIYCAHHKYTRRRSMYDEGACVTRPDAKMTASEYQTNISSSYTKRLSWLFSPGREFVEPTIKTIRIESRKC